MKLGIFYSHPRLEEKALFAAAEADSSLQFTRIKDSDLAFDLHEKSPFEECDAVLLRSVSHTKNYYAAKLIESRGGIAINDSHTIALCGDKFLTSVKLAEKGIPTPKTKVCFDSEQTLKTIEEWGYPVVMKPVVGSWGRLLSKINDRDAAETILEHKTVLGGINHANIFYIQEYIDKQQGQDIRAVVIGNELVAAMYRRSAHWITNTARGADVEPYQVTPEFEKLVLAAAKAVNESQPAGAILAVDLIETGEGLKVVEVNSGAEWHGLIETTDVDMPQKIIEFCKSLAR